VDPQFRILDAVTEWQAGLPACLRNINIAILGASLND
jgi:hypothetical protein